MDKKEAIEYLKEKNILESKKYTEKKEKTEKEKIKEDEQQIKKVIKKGKIYGDPIVILR